MRTSNSIKNTITALILSICSATLGIIAQALFLKILNVEYLGINGLFTNVIAMLSIAELGIGNAIIVNLYKPVYQNDTEKIKSLMHFYRKAYNLVAIIILVIGLALIPFLKYIISDVSIDINLTIIYLLFLFGTISSYLLIYKRSIFTAHQKNYVLNIIEMIYIFAYNISQLLVLYITKNYYLYLSIKIFCQVLENIFISIYANKEYKYLKDKNFEKLDKETEKNIFSKIKALFFHKIASFIVKGTDNILISKFLGVTTVGLYSNYNTIIHSVNNLFSRIISSTVASVGNLLVEKDTNKTYQVFKKINFLNFWISTFSSNCLLIIIQTFITIWIGKEYLLNEYVIYVLIFNYFLNIMKYSYSVFKDAAGIWQEDKYIPIIESIINLIFSLILVNKIGLVGIFLGTLISSLTKWLYSYPKYVYKKLFKKSYKEYIKENGRYLFLFIFITTVSYYISLQIKLENKFLQLISNTLTAIFIPNILIILTTNKTKEFKYYMQLVKKISTKIKRGVKNAG